MGTGRRNFDHLPVKTLYQRIILALGITDDYVVVCNQVRVGNLPLGTEGLAAAGCAQNQTVGVFVKRNFLGAGKSYTIKGKQAEKKAKNALCGRLKCVLVAGNIKPLPTS